MGTRPLPKALSVVVSLRAEDTCDARLAARGPLPLAVAVCGPGLPHVERSMRVGLAFPDQPEQLFALIPKSLAPSPLSAAALGGASSGAGHTNNEDKASILSTLLASLTPSLNRCRRRRIRRSTWRRR
jgi:hypothetical protein